MHLIIVAFFSLKKRTGNNGRFFSGLSASGTVGSKNNYDIQEQPL